MDCKVTYTKEEVEKELKNLINGIPNDYMVLYCDKCGRYHKIKK
jgi:hypothetical protein